MKKTIKTIVIAAASILLAATSCKKETNEVPVNGPVTISIIGAIDDFSQAEQIKATAEPVVRVMWTNGDIVSVYDGTKKLGQLKVTTKEGDARYAYLTNDGTIESPQGSVITLVYSNGCTQEFESGVLSCDISKQNVDQFPFVVYATLQAATTITNVTVPFKFATSVMKVFGTGLGDGKGITEASVDQVNTVCQLTIANSAEPVVAGAVPGTISRGAKFSESGDGRVAFTIALASTATGSARNVSLVKAGKTYEAEFADNEIKAGVSYNSVYAFAEVNYVVINGLKWARENLAISKSGKREFNGTGHVNGDYFQWATYEDYLFPGYLEYFSFTSKKCGDEEEEAILFVDSNKGKFGSADSPYYDAATKTYNYYDATNNTLDRTGTYSGHNDDVANAILGGTWRMPTESEFKDLLDNTYWALDEEDCGYYVFLPGEGTQGVAGGKGTFADTDDKTKAVLFFPASGYGYNGGMKYPGSRAYYWTSSINKDDAKKAWHLYIRLDTETVSVANFQRLYGCCIRPVSD